jgi:4-azaleucine resistance transporter AzlC
MEVVAAAQRSHRASWIAGIRAAIPLAIACVVIGISFGVLAKGFGLTALNAILMSVTMFALSSQTAAVGILGVGGSITTTVVAVALMNARFVLLGVGLAQHLRAGPLMRAIQSMSIADTSWALARDPAGGFDRHFFFGASLIQYSGVVGGTTIGALLGSSLDPHALGLDAVFPAFFLALLLTADLDSRAQKAAVAGGLIALALVPFAQAGIPVLVAATAALMGLRWTTTEPRDEPIH